MEPGFVGEFYVYYLDDQHRLLVDPNEEIAPNFEHYKRNKKKFSAEMFRGLRSIVLKKNEKLLPVKIKDSDGFYEGLYILTDK